MPVIEFGEEDILRGKIITPAWYRVKVNSIGEAPSRNGESTNYPVDGTIVKNADSGDEEFTGVPINWMFNSKAISFAIGFLNALGQEVTPNKRFELSDASGHEVDVFIENDTYNGRLVNRVNHKYRTPR